MKRNYLPLNGLRVFDAAARHLSFTRAADELAVTPAAVGQQIRALEDMLGVVLFRRMPKGLELTDEAQAGLEALRYGFLQFEEAVRAMRAGQSSRFLTIAAPRELISKWLTLRLGQCSYQMPGVHFTLVSAEEPLDFTQANLDLAIIWARDAGHLEGVGLAPGAMLTVIGPSSQEGAAEAGAAEAGAAEAGVAEENSRKNRILWPGCSALATQEASDDKGKPISSDTSDNSGDNTSAPKGTVLHVGDAGLAIDAAAQCLGQACVPALLAEADLAAGRVRALGEPSVHESRYWLVAPLPQWRQKKVRTLVEMLTA